MVAADCTVKKNPVLGFLDMKGIAPQAGPYSPLPHAEHHMFSDVQRFKK